MLEDTKNKVFYRIVDERSGGQRIDNFLLKILKGVPKSHIYKLLRSGQVRVNKKRIKTDFKLTLNDSVRIPPVSFKDNIQINKNYRNQNQLDINIIYEDEALLVINKSSGMAVHGGSGVSFGVIELIRSRRPDAKFLELIHRIDKDTSGILLIAKKRTALVDIHKQIREKKVHKKYVVAVNGEWKEKQKILELKLFKTMEKDGQKVRVIKSTKENILVKNSKSVFFLKKNFGNFSLLDVKLITGRTHQIRVQLSHIGFPILGDKKYGDFNLNKNLKKTGLKSMFLHASEFAFIHPITKKKIIFKAKLPNYLESFIKENG